MSAPNYLHDGIRVRVPAGDTITAGQMVKISSGVAVPVAAGDGLFGVAANNAVAGGDVIVHRYGVFRFGVAEGATIDYGTVVFAASASTVTHASEEGNTSVGVVVDFYSGTEVWVQITPADLTAVTIPVSEGGGS
ncbi:MAG: DUF2190 family protein [candidate division WOR-3 bacterium]